MNGNQIRSIQVVGFSGEEHSFDNAQDLRMNTESGLAEVVYGGGSFVMQLDRLRYFHIHFASPRGPEVSYRRCEIVLTGVGQESPRSLTLSDVMKFEWRVDQGLLMIFCREATVGVHLDHLVSFQFEN